jgi:signal transduction histidine kinase
MQRSEAIVMLGFMTAAFLALSIFLTYRNLKHLSTRFLYGIIFGWVASLLGLVFYVSKHAYYFNILTRLFSLNHQAWRRIILLDVPIDFSIRLIYIGVWLFAFSLAGFAFSFCDLFGTIRRRRTVIAILSVGPLMDLVYHDPGVFKLFKTVVFDLEPGSYLNPYQGIIGEAINIAFWVLRALYYVVPLVVLWGDYATRPRVAFFKRYYLFHAISLTSISIVHAVMFFWTPRNMVKGTLIREYFFYQTPDFDGMILSLRVFPFFTFAVLSILVFLIFRFNSAEAYHRSFDVHISRSIDTANLGIRAFTHSIKNHIVAIDTEARHIQQIVTDDPTVTSSIERILRSCEVSFRYFDGATRRLGAITLDLHPVRLREIVSRLPAHRVEDLPNVHFSIDTGGGDTYCYVDEKHFVEVLQCLLDNAVEAIGNEEGSIRVGLFCENGWGAVEVRDTGCGIPQDIVKMIYSPFFSTKASATNWGIGLSFCHKIVSAHDGKLSVETEPGKGSTFRVALPVAWE